MASGGRARTAEEQRRADEHCEPGQYVRVEGIMSPMRVERDNGTLVAIGPQGGRWQLVQTDRGLRAKSGPAGLSSRAARVVPEPLHPA